MRSLLALVLFMGLGWSGYWFLGAQAKERAIAGWLEERRAEGWVVETGAIVTRGFPNRFDTTIENIELADPETGVAWSAPFFQILALSYRPHHVIAVWPERQTIATPYQTLTLTSGGLRGSLEFVPGLDLRLDRGIVEFDRAGLVSTLGWQASAQAGQLAVRQTPVRDNTYDLSFRAADLVLPGRLKDALAREGLVDEDLAALDLAATVTFDEPWDRRAIEDRRPQPRRIDLDLARATWGELDLRLAGELRIDGRGRPDGEITVKATNWREILTLAEASGALAPQVADLMERGLTTVARLSGNPDTIDVPLGFDDGRITLGGLLPLGEAPRLILR